MKTADYESSGQHRKQTYVCSDRPERKRVYLFPGGDRIEIDDVVEARASRHGNHQLTTVDGVVHVIPWGWICLSFPAESKVTPQEVIDRGETPFQPLDANVVGEQTAALSAHEHGPFGLRPDPAISATADPTVDMSWLFQTKE